MNRKETTKPQDNITAEQSTYRSWPGLFHFSEIASRISIVLGVIAALFGFYESRERAAFAAQAQKLQSLSYIQTFIEEDVKVQQLMADFDYTKFPKWETQLNEQSGRNLYFSKGLVELQTIGEHYERMGAEVKLNYLDFKLVFEIVPFPDEFWERSRALRKALRENWGGKGKPLNDLWSNFGSLCEQYRAERRRVSPKDPERDERNVELCQE